jgi:hypothetical protein
MTIEIGTKIDLWFGVDSGYGRKLEGVYVEHSPSEDRIRAKVLDKEFLEMIGMEDDPDPYIVDAYRLKDNHWVYYDDFAWSPKGEIQEKDLVDEELHGF